MKHYSTMHRVFDKIEADMHAWAKKQGYMTGAEWLQRFKSEMGDGAHNCDGCSCDAMEAAKRASEVKE